MSCPRIETPAERLALEMWRERERTFPAFVRHDPDALDVASGAWPAMVAEAQAALAASALPRPAGEAQKPLALHRLSTMFR